MSEETRALQRRPHNVMKNEEFELNSHFSQVAADHGDMQQDRETGYNVVVVDIS